MRFKPSGIIARRLGTSCEVRPREALCYMFVSRFDYREEHQKEIIEIRGPTRYLDIASTVSHVPWFGGVLIVVYWFWFLVSG